MDWTGSVNFLIKFFLLYPIIIYICCLFKLLIFSYNRVYGNAYLNLGEQGKLIKGFSEKYLDIKKDHEKLLREVYAQQLTTFPNVSARFVAYCIRREVSNLNFIFYLFNVCHSLVSVIDSKGESSLRLRCKKGKIYTFFILINFILFAYAITILFYDLSYFTPLIGVFVNSFAFVCALISTIKLYKLFCLILLIKNLDDVVYEDLSKSKKTCYISCCSHLFDTICCRYRKQNMSAFETLRKLEYKQLQHDDRYHKDIWVLSTQGKARHMAAHIGKYSGQVLEAIRYSHDEEKIKDKVIDSLIINFSYANIFLSLVSEGLQKNNTTDHVTLDGLIHFVGDKYIEQQKYEGSDNCGLELAMDFCILSGLILKTVESMDHMEIHSYRENFNLYSLSIFKILSALCKQYNIKDIDNKIEKRLVVVEKRNPFYPYLGTHDKGYLN